MTAETTVRLSHVDNIVGIKEASGDLGQIARIIEACPEGAARRGAGPDFRVWSGADEDTLPMLSVGSYGVISVISHLVGRQLRSMIEDAVSGRAEAAARTHRRLLPLIQA